MSSCSTLPQQNGNDFQKVEDNEQRLFMYDNIHQFYDYHYSLLKLFYAVKQPF